MSIKLLKKSLFDIFFRIRYIIYHISNYIFLNYYWLLKGYPEFYFNANIMLSLNVEWGIVRCSKEEDIYH
jgi:hypothetical protein